MCYYLGSMKNNLSQYHPGQGGVVTQVAKGALYAKMIEMGLFQGKHVKVLFTAPFGDPMAVDVEGYVLSLRKEEADLIEIES